MPVQVVAAARRADSCHGNDVTTAMDSDDEEDAGRPVIDDSLQWEDFFGPTVDLVPALLDIYDALIAAAAPRRKGAVSMPNASAYEYDDRSRTLPATTGVDDDSAAATRPSIKRPLSISSTSSTLSSSSSSTSTSSLSSCTSSLSRGCYGNKRSYLASIESLEDDEDLDEEDRKKADDDSQQGGSNSLGHTERVVLEIVETEGTYVRDLREIIQGYLQHLKEGNELGDDTLAHLFSNVEEIYRFNKRFLEELEKCRLDPVLVAQAFVAHTKGFAIYTEYCTNYPRTVSVLTELMRRAATAEMFKARQAALGHMLPLGSYLLKPVQRILKYHLLLQNAARHYASDREGYDDVVAALATMTGIACHINDMKRRHEHAVRVQEIQSLLYGWEGQDLTTYGELVAEGTFRVYGAKAVRHVFLFDRMLLVTKRREDGGFNYKTHVLCSNLMLIESIPGEPLCFHVIPFDCPRVQHTFQARNLEQKREWALQLKRVILENYDVDIPSHARELVMQLGQSRPEDEILAERGNCSRRTHSAPEYLERRNRLDREKRRMVPSVADNLNRALRISRGGSRKKDFPVLGGIGCDAWNLAHCQSAVPQDHNIQRNLSASSLPSPHKAKKAHGWRRKSEPCELLSSQESLGRFGRSLSTSHAANEAAAHQEPPEEDYVTFLAANLQGSPTTPAVWLRQQRHHLAEAPTPLKAGSLPRRFPLAAPALPRRELDRPFTIASDKPASDLDRSYVEDSTVDDSEEEDHAAEHVHPDNRIYRPSLSRSSLRSLVAAVGAKLTRLRPTPSVSSGSSEQSCSSMSLGPAADDDRRQRRSRSAERERLTSKLLVSFAQVYARVVRARASGGQQHPAIPIHRQGSPAIGARMARLDAHSDYEAPPWRCNKAPAADDDDTAESDASGESSYYERTFDAIESLLEWEPRDSVLLFGDDDDAAPAANTQDEGMQLRLSLSNPETVSAATEDAATPRRSSQGILERLRHLEQCSQYSPCRSRSDACSSTFKSIKERCRELELWRTVPPDDPVEEPSTARLGWVRSVVEQLQRDT